MGSLMNKEQEKYIEETRDGLRTQIREAYGRLVYTHTTHLKQAHIIQTANAVVQWLLIAFSAISTAGLIGIMFSFSPVALAIVSGVFTAASLAVNLYSRGARLGERAERHRSVANDLWPIREDYVSLLTDLDTMDDVSIRKIRDELKDKVAAIYSNAPLTSKRAYRLAQKALKEEEEQYFSPDELDQIIPEHLRTGSK